MELKVIEHRMEFNKVKFRTPSSKIPGEGELFILVRKKHQPFLKFSVIIFAIFSHFKNQT